MQTSIANEQKNIHPILYYTQLWNTGYLEGWALYAERLADEMQLYSNDLYRVGLISNALVRAARLIVDPSIHIFSWTKKQAIDFLFLPFHLSGEHRVMQYIENPAKKNQATARKFRTSVQVNQVFQCRISPSYNTLSLQKKQQKKQPQQFQSMHLYF